MAGISFIGTLILAVGMAAAFTVKRAIKTDVTALIMKAAASMCFVILGFVCCIASGNMQLPVLLGLMFGVMGDIFLDMKYVYAEHADLHTFTGFIAFLIGHLFYTFHLTGVYKPGIIPIIISVVIGIIAGFGIYFTPKLMKLDYGRFRLISAFYAAYLIFVTALSVCIMITEIQKGSSPASIMFAAGMVLFLLSDLVLSQIYFGKDKNTPANIAVNHGLYYAAQIVIAASIMFM